MRTQHINLRSTPLISTSANLSSEKVIRIGQDILKIFPREIAVVWDAGILPDSLLSAIVKFETGSLNPQIFRQGTISEEEILVKLR